MGEFKEGEYQMSKIGKCCAEGCENTVLIGRGMCSKHYTRFYRQKNVDGFHPRGKGNAHPKKITFDIDENGCFNCTSHYLDKDGYPKIQANKKPYRMSRYVYEQNFGPIPEGKIIRHKCDNPTCINPDHLEVGTHLDNAKDMDERGRRRSVFGEGHPNSKLTESQVREIKVLLRDENMTQEKIAKRFNVCRRTISKIKTGQLWGKVALRR